MKIDPQLRDILERVPILSDANDISVDLLSGGLTNTSYLAIADAERYVIRIVGLNSDVLGIDRSRERVALRRAEESGIGAEVVAMLPEGHLVTRFSTGEPLSVERFTSAEMLPRVAARLRDIHALDPIDGDFDPFGDIRRWLAIADSRDTPRPVRFPPLLDRVHAVESALARRERENVLCHNDPYHLNFLDGTVLRVIDWEYAGMGDPMYDLAGVGYALDRSGRDLLLKSYFAVADANKRDELDALISVYLCWNVAWCLLQVEDSVVDFDFMGFAEGLLDGVW